jgi:hypothetical protein
MSIHLKLILTNELSVVILKVQTISSSNQKTEAESDWIH